MTLPYERSSAFMRGRSLLHALCNPKKTPGVPRAVREQALRVLRHYPSPFELIQAVGPDAHGPLTPPVFDITELERLHSEEACRVALPEPPCADGGAPSEPDARALLARARNMLSHPAAWTASVAHTGQRWALSEEIAGYLSATRERGPDCGVLGNAVPEQPGRTGAEAKEQG